MKKLILIIALFWSASASAAALSGADSALIKQAGIPIYSKANFVYGTRDVGFRFATSVSADAVKRWYREQLPKWAVLEEYGGWIMYNGKPGASMGDVMSKHQVSVQKNDKLPEWHALDKGMTTEIVIMIPQ